ncbi:MAG TPA: hypothetical protein DDW85_08645 [Porphyromonadaceae bacterium]|nr:hypothetical protein [Porphyromonadaceae bacterium]
MKKFFENTRKPTKSWGGKIMLKIMNAGVYLHGKGIGSRWADALEKGDEIKLIGPGGSLKYKVVFFYLTGRVKSIRAVKEFLISKGISQKEIKTEPYWNEGKEGL